MDPSEKNLSRFYIQLHLWQPIPSSYNIFKFPEDEGEDLHKRISSAVHIGTALLENLCKINAHCHKVREEIQCLSLILK